MRTILSLLTTPLLMEPRIPLPFWVAGALLAHVKIFIYQDHPRFSCAGLLSSSSSPSLYKYMGLPQPKCEALHFALLNLIMFTWALLSSLSRSLSMASIPTNGTTHLGVISKLAAGALDPIISVTDKDVKEYQSQDRPLGDTTHYWPLPGHRTIDHHPLSLAFQPIPYPPGGPAIKSTSF